MDNDFRDTSDDSNYRSNTVTGGESINSNVAEDNIPGGNETQQARLAAIREALRPGFQIAFPDATMPNFYIVESPDAGAGVDERGQIGVTTALLEALTDEELKGIIAHELAHSALGHVGIHEILENLSPAEWITREELAPFIETEGPYVNINLANVRRSLECQADHAASFMVSPRDLTEALQAVAAGNDESLSHPATDDRIRMLSNPNIVDIPVGTMFTPNCAPRELPASNPEREL